MITFAEHMEQALYGPAGYYSSGVAKSGKQGDYFTAPDVGAAFGLLLTHIFRAWAEKLGGRVELVEVGAGEGRLARDILSQHPFAYTAVERSKVRRSSLAALQKTFSTLQIREDISELSDVAGILFGNELIDAFPVHRVRWKDGRWHELFVDGMGERRRFAWKEPSTPELEAYFRRIHVTPPEGYETEANLAMASWMQTASRVLKKGLIVLIDYGRPAHDYYAPERTRGTLRAFSNHKVSSDFLDPGRLVDLTADVDFTSLALDARQAGLTPLAFMEMGTFLLQGAQTLSQAPKGLKYLIHPDGLGVAFHVLVLGKDIGPKDMVFEHNRLSRLALP